MFTGAFTALITPFDEQARIDKDFFLRIVESQIDNNIDGLVPCGTTGESPTLTISEHNDLIELCCQTVSRRVPVIAGVGSNCTKEAVEMAVHAEKSGADALLVVIPYYNRPSSEGVYLHFKEINDKTNLPIIVYNVPSRVGRDITMQELIRLFTLKNVKGIKDATGDVSRATAVKQNIGNVCLLSGDDNTAIAFNASGGQGIISVVSNLIPGEVATMQALCRNNDFLGAQRSFSKYYDLLSLMSCEVNPIPVKYAMGLLYQKEYLTYRLPLTMPTQYNQKEIKNSMLKHGLID